MQAALRQLRDELTDKPARGRSYEILSFMVDQGLERPENAERLTFEAAQLLAGCGTPAEKEIDPKDWVPAVETIRKALARLQQPFSNDRLQLGYSKGGGRGVVSLYWLEPETDASPTLESPEPGSTINYRRTPKGAINPSLAARLFLRHGEMRNRSLRGLLFLTSLMLGVLFWVASLAVIFLVLGVRNDPMTARDLLVAVLATAGFWIGWRQVYSPWFQVIDDCVVKAPHWATGILEDSCELEMFRHEQQRWTRLVRFSADCPFCGGNIVLMSGRPDQAPPLVGRCVESPHAHVYSFDRTTLKGTYLGPPYQ
jgi:hypothetical protein